MADLQYIRQYFKLSNLLLDKYFSQCRSERRGRTMKRLSLYPHIYCIFHQFVSRTAEDEETKLEKQTAEKRHRHQQQQQHRRTEKTKEQ